MRLLQKSIYSNLTLLLENKILIEKELFYCYNRVMGKYLPESVNYLEKLFSYVLSYPSRCFLLEESVPPIFLTHELPMFVNFSRNSLLSELDGDIVCNVTRSKKDIETVNALLKQNFLHIKSPAQCDLISAEIISKILAYRDLQMGDQLEIPLRTSFGKIHHTTYTVDHAFGKKFIAFGLTAKNMPSLLIFRGTDFNLLTKGGRMSIISDLDPSGPGKSFFHDMEEDISSWLERQKKSVRLFGHSLGGAFVTYTLTYKSDFINKNKHLPSYAFNHPGGSLELLAKYHSLKKKPSFIGVISRGDVVPKFGKLFGSIYESYSLQKLSPIRAHEKMIFLEPRSMLHKVNLEKENESESRKQYSGMQNQFSSMLYDAGLKHLYPFKRKNHE